MLNLSEEQLEQLQAAMKKHIEEKAKKISCFQIITRVV